MSVETRLRRMVEDDDLGGHVDEIGIAVALEGQLYEAVRVLEALKNAVALSAPDRLGASMEFAEAMAFLAEMKRDTRLDIGR
jgi:hypothetical protein